MTLHNNDRGSGMPILSVNELSQAEKETQLTAEKITKHLEAGKAYPVIASLQSQRDIKQKIVHATVTQAITGEEGAVTEYVLREANIAVEPDQDSDSLSYDITALSFLQATFNLLECYNQNTTDKLKQVSALFDRFKKNAEQGPQTALSDLIHNQLTPFLAEKLCFSEKTALDVLYVARNFVPLNHHQRDVLTKSQLSIKVGDETKKLTMVQAEFTDGRLTDELKKEFAACNNEDPEKQPEWFFAQSPEHRAIIRYHIPAILEGRQISSQLREMIPGVKNFAKQKVGAVELDEQRKEKIVWLTEVNHCGTIACLIPGVSQAERQRITNLNAAQLRKLTRAEDGDHFVLTTLNSAKNPFGNDNQIVWQTLKALPEGSNNLPLNLLRLVSSNNDEGMRELIRYIGELYQSECATISDGVVFDSGNGLFHAPLQAYLVGKGSVHDNKTHDIARAFTLTSPDNLTKEQQQVRNIVVLAYQLKLRLDRGCSLSDPDNQNLNRLGLFHQLCYALNCYADRPNNVANDYQEKIKRAIPLVACQTGKDRVGLAAMMTAITGVMSHLVSGGATISAKNRDTVRGQIAEQLAKAGHQQHMAAARGCSLGCWGLVRDARFAMPSWFTEKTRRFLMRDTAKNNHPNIAKPKKGEKYRPDPSDNLNDFQQFRHNSIKKLESYIRSRQRKLKYGGWFYTVKALKIKIHAAQDLVHVLRCAKEGEKLGAKIKKASKKNLLAKNALQTRYTKSCCMFAFKPTDGQFGVLIDELSRGFSALQASKSQMCLDKI